MDNLTWKNYDDTEGWHWFKYLLSDDTCVAKVYWDEEDGEFTLYIPNENKKIVYLFDYGNISEEIITDKNTIDVLDKFLILANRNDILCEKEISDVLVKYNNDIIKKFKEIWN